MHIGTLRTACSKCRTRWTEWRGKPRLPISEIRTPNVDVTNILYRRIYKVTSIREIRTPIGDGNIFSLLIVLFRIALIREIRTPIGDGNVLVNSCTDLENFIREIRTPVGDGNKEGKVWAKKLTH